MARQKLPADPQDYFVHNDISLEDLAKVYSGKKGCSLPNLKRRSTKEKWLERRYQNDTKTILKTDEQLTGIKAAQTVSLVNHNPLLSKERLLEELCHIAYSRIDNILEIDVGGEIVYKPFTEVSESAIRAIKKAKEKRKILDQQDGQTGQILDSHVEMDQYDKLKAIGMISDLMGYSKPEIKPSVPEIKPLELSSYTDIWKWSEDEKLLFFATGQRPEGNDDPKTS